MKPLLKDYVLNRRTHHIGDCNHICSDFVTTDDDSWQWQPMVSPWQPMLVTVTIYEKQKSVSHFCNKNLSLFFNLLTSNKTGFERKPDQRRKYKACMIIILNNQQQSVWFWKWTNEFFPLGNIQCMTTNSIVSHAFTKQLFVGEKSFGFEISDDKYTLLTNECVVPNWKWTKLKAFCAERFQIYLPATKWKLSLIVFEWSVWFCFWKWTKTKELVFI